MLFEKVKFEIFGTDHIAYFLELQAINLHYWKSDYNRIFLIVYSSQKNTKINSESIKDIKKIFSQINFRFVRCIVFNSKSLF